MPVFAFLLFLAFTLSVPAHANTAEDKPANGCARSETRGFSCSFHVGDSPPQSDDEVERVARQCFEDLQRSCNEQQGGTTCRWTARFTCKKIIDQARHRQNSAP